jgi:hypothetical protein
MHDVVSETQPRRGQYLNPLPEQNDACDRMPFKASDAVVKLKHSTTDATQARDLLAENMETWSRGNWF